MAKKQTVPALVPVEEQPYPVPENWVYFYFTNLIDISGGTQPPKKLFTDKESPGYARLVQLRDFSSDKYKVYIPDTPNLRHFNETDILIARYGASLGKICSGLAGVYNVALQRFHFRKIFYIENMCIGCYIQTSFRNL